MPSWIPVAFISMAVLQAVAAGGCLSPGSKDATEVTPGHEPVLIVDGCPASREGIDCRLNDTLLELGGSLELDGGTGLFVFADRNVTIRNLAIHGAVTGINILVDANCSCSIQLSNVSMTGRPTGLPVGTGTMQLGTGLRIGYDPHSGSRPATTVTLQDVSIGGFDVGLLAFGLNRLHADATKLVGGFVGVDVEDIDDIRLTSCSLKEFAEDAIRPHNYETLLIRDCVIAENGLGIYEASTGFLGTVTIDETGFERNGLAIAFHYRAYTISNSDFIDNGLGRFSPSHNLTSGGILVHTSAGLADPNDFVLTVRSSSFTGNQGFAIQDGAPSSFVDARENWWGSPLGPSLGGPSGPAYAGDVVDASVMVYPFLSTPP